MKSEEKVILLVVALFLLANSNLFTTYPIRERIIDAVIVNDVSGSMVFFNDTHPCSIVPEPEQWNCPINQMKRATKNLTSIILFDEDNFVGLVTYDDQVVSSMALNRNEQALLSHIDSYESYGGATCCACGLQRGIDIIDSGRNPDRLLLFMSDGECNYPLNTSKWGMVKQEAIDKANEAIFNHNITLYCVAFGPVADIVTMQQMCEHGTYLYASEENLEELYQMIGYEWVPQANPEYRPLYWFDQLWNQIWEIIQEILGWLGL